MRVEAQKITVNGSTLSVLGVGVALFTMAFGAFTHFSGRIDNLSGRMDGLDTKVERVATVSALSISLTVAEGMRETRNNNYKGKTERCREGK